MDKNIIVLTHGWSGSSAFSALLARAGYSLGSETVRKVDYDTHENAELVAHNRGLLLKLAPTLNYQHSFDFRDILMIERAAASLDLRPYRDFVIRCNERGPWLWKDPRLTWTIRIWARVLDLENLAFLVLTRDDLQAWSSANNRRHVQSMRFTRQYNHGITSANVHFLQLMRLPYLRTSFEELLLKPEDTLARLNARFDINLSMGDLKRACREPLYRSSRGWQDHLRAALIYAKNYRERDGRGSRIHASGGLYSLADRPTRRERERMS